ncbi:MAG TPA: response regulator transcription factor [Dehalococcoidia bacterium]|nr:response regulator transcription factor [Dehalococcoidia bacterium]
MRRIKVLIVDDHAIVRDGVSTLLSLAGDIEVIGEAANGKEGLEKVGKLLPDVVLMDIAMPIMGGLEAIRRIRKAFSGVKILALTQYDDKEHVFPAIQSGANGFVSKTSASSELTAGIRAVFTGESYLSPSIAKLFVEDYRQVSLAGGKSDPYEELTDREREILKLVVEGYKTRQIAEILSVTPKTVEAHKTSLMKKLGIHSNLELVKYALRRGIISM